MSNNNNSLYILSLRTVIIIIAIVFAVGAAGGTLAAWYTTQKLLKEKVSGTRIVERVVDDKGTEIKDYSALIEEVKSGIVGVLDDEGELLQTGVVLTADGVVVTPAQALLPRPPKVMLMDGEVRPSSVLREYSEHGLVMLRVNGSFPAPQFAEREEITAGAVGVLIRPDANTFGAAVEETLVKRVGMAEEESLQNFSGLGEIGYLQSVQLESGFNGAPLFLPGKRLAGIVLALEDNNRIMLAPILDFLLQDFLKHPDGNSVKVFERLEGDWLEGLEARKLSLPVSRAFHVKQVPARSNLSEAGLKRGDIITGLNENDFPAAGNMWAVFLESARNDKPVKIKVWRDKTEDEVIYEPEI